MWYLSTVPQFTLFGIQLLKYLTHSNSVRKAVGYNHLYIILSIFVALENDRGHLSYTQ